MTNTPESGQSEQQRVVPERFDLIIVGSGSGNSIPEYLSDWSIALVEKGVFGGTCLNVGCIPSKMFVLPADLAESARHSDKVGVDLSFNGVDWPAIRDRVFGRIDPIAAGGEEYRASGTPNVTLIKGTARFTADREFLVDDGTEAGRAISAPRVLLAAGARPVAPPIDGLDTVGSHTSDSVMRLETFPERLGIIGGGFIAVEMGHVFSGFGSDVTLFNRSGALLRAQDDEVSQRFTEVFGQRVTLRLNEVPSRVERLADDTIALHPADGGEPVVVDQLLVATGRTPNSDLVDAAAGGLPMRSNGTVEVDDTMATSIEGVWAIGDIANSYQLKHLANAEAKVAFHNMANPDDQRTVSYRAVPSAVFSHPQVATVGLTEAQVVAEGIPHRVGRRDFGGTAYGWALEDDTSFAKVIIHAETEEILGAHIIGPQSASLIQPLIQAMELGQSARTVAEDVFYIHPALTEVVENALLEALNA